MQNFATAFAAIAIFTSANADAQFGGLLGQSLGMPASGEAGGAYQSRNQIRTYISTGPHDNANLYEKVIIKAAEMAHAKGFAQFGVTKVSCSTFLMHGSPLAKGCYIIAVMLPVNGLTDSRGKRQVQYYKVSDVHSGVIAPSIE